MGFRTCGSPSLPNAGPKPGLLKHAYQTTVLLDSFKHMFEIALVVTPARKRPAPAVSEENTRDRILSAAGEVFAEQGFDGATIRAITERAGVNVAAVNYHFRDKAELYARVVVDACAARAAWREAMAAAADSPEERLRSLIGHFVEYLLDPERPDWRRRLMAREMANPTAALDELVEKNIRPLRDEFLMPTLRQLTAGRFSQRQLSYIGASIMAQCHYYLQSRPIIERLNPGFKIGDSEIREIAEHIARFSLAALAELTRQARRS
jgi:TetR/AcrR family transcriptional regulator, regulator of cefoperazone and chloramphenicol sensitivity